MDVDASDTSVDEVWSPHGSMDDFETRWVRVGRTFRDNCSSVSGMEKSSSKSSSGGVGEGGKGMDLGGVEGTSREDMMRALLNAALETLMVLALPSSSGKSSRSSSPWLGSGLIPTVASRAAFSMRTFVRGERDSRSGWDDGGGRSKSSSSSQSSVPGEVA